MRYFQATDGKITVFRSTASGKAYKSATTTGRISFSTQDHNGHPVEEITKAQYATLIARKTERLEGKTGTSPQDSWVYNAKPAKAAAKPAKATKAAKPAKATKPAAKPAKATKATKATKAVDQTEAKPVKGAKATILEMIQRPNGASIAEVQEALGWGTVRATIRRAIAIAPFAVYQVRENGELRYYRQG